jgi:hypothetical protein
MVDRLVEGLKDCEEHCSVYAITHAAYRGFDPLVVLASDNTLSGAVDRGCLSMLNLDEIEES